MQNIRMLRPCFICFALWIALFSWAAPGRCAELKRAHPKHLTVNAGKAKPHKRRVARLSAQTSYSLLFPRVSKENLTSLNRFVAVKPPVQSDPMFPVMPEFKPAGDIVTPRQTVPGEPGYADYAAPGVSATVRTGRNTAITGAASLPGFSSPPPRPYEEPESGNRPAAAAGVKVTRSF